MAQESLVSISEASHILGVSEASLRQWTDEGKIKAFVTPGGHRRYSKAELIRFMDSNQKMLGIKDLVVELADPAKMHREIFRASIETTSRYSRLNAESREHLAHLGRRLLGLIVQYITEPSQRQETLKLARDIGNGLGETLVNAGLSLTDSVEAFILHRKPIVDAATHLVSGKEAFDGRIVEAIPLIVQVLDEALVALVATYQQYQSLSQDPDKGDTLA